MGRSRRHDGTALQAYAESPGGGRLGVKGRRTQRTNNIGNFVIMGGDRKSRQNRQHKTGHVQERDRYVKVQVRFGSGPGSPFLGHLRTENRTSGPVRRGLGPNLGSESDCGNTIIVPPTQCSTSYLPSFAGKMQCSKQRLVRDARRRTW